jgi:hypothetical protein
MFALRLMLGAAMLIAVILLACSDRNGNTITSQNTGVSTTLSADSLDAKDDVLNGDQIIWGPAPPNFPAGAQFVVLQGDPSKAGEIFTIRLRFPNGYVLPPHFHPTPEYVTVIRGTFLAGMGENFSRDRLVPYNQNGFATMPVSTPHYAMMRGITEVQVHAIGPFALTYVHPEDDPTRHP